MPVSGKCPEDQKRVGKICPTCGWNRELYNAFLDSILDDVDPTPERDEERARRIKPASGEPGGER